MSSGRRWPTGAFSSLRCLTDRTTVHHVGFSFKFEFLHCTPKFAYQGDFANGSGQVVIPRYKQEHKLELVAFLGSKSRRGFEDAVDATSLVHEKRQWHLQERRDKDRKGRYIIVLKCLDGGRSGAAT